MLKTKLAVFVSGGGSNLQAIIDAIQENYLKNVEISMVIASKDNIYALERAQKADIPFKIFSKSNYTELSSMFEEIIFLLRRKQIDYVVLAGYLTILTENIIQEYRNKIINIHPSLIPKFCGDGYYGMRVHKAVLDAGEKTSGATVHFVDEGTDTGKIIIQEKVAVYKKDTPESLAKRVLELEHKLLPKAIKKNNIGEGQ